MNLCFFTTTKGHFGRKDIYRITLESLFSKVRNSFFSRRIAHIKITPGEESVAQEMEEYLMSHGFHVLKSVGDWRHNDNSHGAEYNKDIYKVFSSKEATLDRFSFWLEDDWILNGNNIDAKFISAEKFLGRQPEYLSVRVNAEKYEDDKVFGESIFKVQGNNYTQWGPTFTFQPTVTKTDAVHYAYSLLQRNWEQMGHLHVELQSTYSIRSLVLNPTPFAIFPYEDLNCTHIGAPPFEKCLS